ncbi:hypothetical protein MJO28_008980 [Puccinia striiformis f. sp. tritici]|uniref:Transcription factor Pcc1 n=2 Tax=Puccinia striiformis f. sp. tritici TaxID=168172 RepID=A0A0L0UR78_9BASI|nr:hypothetical protein MJO28_008980 [Puccinia striiformis f. sp. tritici]KAI7953201.1 hypothetical protein MJO29_008832 [Puccinia striiformis f. sp. tritici]KAI9603265.1 hypothetical protein H4Q26_002583 [Puccinia striiformis f. sp. tritici PST-130]KAI9606243.1 hypothetical protein KEM48_001952 [Puccinia striiformis f. sp. tritici PST-130]KNE89563.1 hypothetical protein PSTG_16976 [Puccinia striiformis f. sp. tritici PST-78]
MAAEQTHLDSVPSDWHHLSLEVSVPTHQQAQIILKTISPDKPVKSPHFIRRSISIKPRADHLDTPAYILITIAALTLRQARVSMDHLLSDLELVVKTLATFSVSC